MSALNPLVVIVGPTGVGKTEVSIEVAEDLGGEIVSADSRTLYRGMDIGTAKPSPEQLARVRHHLIDVADPKESWSLAVYRRAAHRAIAEIHARGHLPLLVGGTGQYITAVIEGWSPPPRPPDDRIRREWERYAAKHGAQALHGQLEAVDPARAAELDPRNVRRVVRALEIHQLTGVPASELRTQAPPDYRILRLGLHLPRAALYRSIDQRVDDMLKAGLVEEVGGLLAAGLNLDHPCMSAIGYRQIAEHLLGRHSLEQAVAEIKRATRQFVRRQANWFKPDDPAIEWYEVEAGLATRIVERVRRWMATIPL